MGLAGVDQSRSSPPNYPGSFWLVTQPVTVTRWEARAGIKGRTEGLNWFSPRPDEWSQGMAPAKEVSKEETGARWAETGTGRKKTTWTEPPFDFGIVRRTKTNLPKAIIQQCHHYIHSWKVDGRVKFPNWGIRNVWSILWPLSRPATPWRDDELSNTNFLTSDQD